MFKHLKNVLSYVQMFESAFVNKEIEKANAEHIEAVKKQRRILLICKQDVITLMSFSKGCMRIWFWAESAMNALI